MVIIFWTLTPSVGKGKDSYVSSLFKLILISVLLIGELLGRVVPYPNFFRIRALDLDQSKMNRIRTIIISEIHQCKAKKLSNFFGFKKGNFFLRDLA